MWMGMKPRRMGLSFPHSAVVNDVAWGHLG
jgi:hypothetical protein